ncbi:fimbrial protein [Photorhabdus laumondii]|uniref:fimbrial protein n=1 Tax=Photorhabdus laumondii TaxID=2218628 RepID=UPI0025B1C81C|nr:hypothetical protein [Photorhabdus laumondii]
MKRQILKISAVAALVMGAASAALAASAGDPPTPEKEHVGKNTTVMITGVVVAATCDVSSSNTGANVDLGNATPAAFTAGSPIDTQKSIASYVVQNPRPITIYLSNCDDKNTDKNKVQLRVTGPVLGGSENVIFNNSEDGKNVGAILTYMDGTTKRVVANNSDVSLKAEGSKGTDFNGQSITFIAYMASIVPKPEAKQHVNAPITFSYAYN